VKNQIFWDTLSTGDLDQSARRNVADVYVAGDLTTWCLAVYGDVLYAVGAEFFLCSIDYLKADGYFMYRQVQHSQILSFALSVYLCVFVWISEQKKRLFPYAALTGWLLGALAKLRKTITRIILVLSVGPSVCPHGTARHPLDGFNEI
jgi:hypothetical protein